jgi:hypothetical protein
MNFVLNINSLVFLKKKIQKNRNSRRHELQFPSGRIAIRTHGD